jgi:hypothetical protein
MRGLRPYLPIGVDRNPAADDGLVTSIVILSGTHGPELNLCRVGVGRENSHSELQILFSRILKGEPRGIGYYRRRWRQ